MSKMKKSIVVACVLFLAACGQGLSGTYTDETGTTSYRFESGGKVYVDVAGLMESELKYEVDGKKVKIQNPQGGNMIFTLLDDGSIQGMMGMKLSKNGKNSKAKK
jgi:outer membrane lipopolysaccharide assembly protein LptE/RlpB